MRWFKRISVTLLSLFVFLTIIVSLILFILNDENYRSITVSLIENYTNINIRIDGRFTLELSLTPSIHATAIKIHDRNNNYIIEVGNFNISISLRSLIFNNLRIKNLQLDDTNIILKHTLIEAVSPIELARTETNDNHFLLPRLEHILIQNLVLNIEQKNSTLTNYAAITKMNLGLNKSQTKHILDGSGHINNFEFTTNGTFGNFSDLLNTKAFPVDATAKIANMEIQLNGDIQDLLTGTGLNLKFNAHTNDFLKIFRTNNKIPFLGELTAHANITGDLPNITIENLKIDLKNPNNTHISIAGKISKIKAGENTNLALTSTIEDPTILTWLTPTDWPKIRALTVNTILKDNAQGDYTLNDIQLTTSIADDVDLKVTGSAVIKNIRKHTINDINLLITAKAASAKSLQKFISTEIPDLGVITATAQLNGNDKQFSLNQIDIKTGIPKKLRLQATGEIKNITPQSNNPITGINIKLSAQAKNTKILESIIKKPLPDLHNIQFISDLYDNNDLYALKNIQLISGAQKHPDIKITGEINNLANIDGILLKAKFDIKTKKLLHAVDIRKKLPDMGITKGSLLLVRKDNFTSINDIDISLVKSNAWEFSVNGYVSHLLSDRNFIFKTSSKITNWTDLKEILEIKNLDFEPQTGTGILSGDKNNTTFRNTLSIGKTQFDFGIAVTKNKSRYSITTELNSKVLYLNDFGIKPKDIDFTETDNKSDPDKQTALFSDALLPFDKLNIFNLAANIKIDKISGKQNSLNSLDIKIVLDNGNLRIHPAYLNFPKGNVKLDLGIENNINHKSYIKLYIKDVNLEAIMSQLQTTPIIKGSLNTLIKLQSSGDSLQKIAKNSTGEITILGENIEVLKKYTNLLVNDTLGWASSSIGLSRQYSEWSCTILKFIVADNKIRSETIIVDGPDMRLDGKLTIDLLNETIDMSLWPNQKNTLWLNVRPITLIGPLRDPVVNTLSVGTSNLARTYTEFTFYPIFLSLRALGYVNANILPSFSKKNGPCQKLEKEILESNKNKAQQ